MDGLILVLRVFKPAAKLIPGANEYLDSIFTLLETLCTLAKDVEEVDEDIRMLIERETRLSTLIFDKFRTVSDEEVQRLPALLPNFQQALSDTQRLLQRQCRERASTSPRMGRFFRVVKRAVRVQSDKVLVQQLNRRIDNVAEAFQIESSIERLLNDERLHSTMEELESWIRERLKVLDTVELERLVTALDPVHGASAFAESAPRPCLEGTCTAILDDLVQWALYDSLVPVFWLSGPAGTGKSTIARTLCDIIHSRIRPTELQKHLITFFVARDAVHRRNPIRILHTLLHGFARAVPAYRPWLLNTLADEPDILVRPVKVQASVLFNGFFDEFETEESGLAFIVVVDGLDECERINGIEGGDFLSALLSMVQSSRAPIRLLVASRRSEGVTRIMTSLPFLSIRAHTIDLPHAEGDVRHYLTHEFSRIAQCRNLQSWPQPSDLEAVVASAGGLFIYATTVVRFVDDSIFNPVQRLQALLDPEFVSTASAPSAEYVMLDDMYTRILHAAIPSEYSDRQVRAAATVFRRVVAALVLVQDHISVATLATLLDTDSRAVSQIVRNLSAVLLLEIADVVRVYHPSFTDFLLDPSRCSDPLFCLASPDSPTIAGYHAAILKGCIRVMNESLSEDVCRLRDIGALNPDVTIAVSSMSGALQYAVTHWVRHISLSTPPALRAQSRELLASLDTFMGLHALHWIEALSLLRHVHYALEILHSCVEWYRATRSRPNRFAAHFSCLEDLTQFLTLFHVPISCAALQTYVCAACFAPRLTKPFSSTQTPSLQRLELLSEPPSGWSRIVLQTHALEEGSTSGTDLGIDIVAASRDSLRLASAHGDGTLRVWDATSGDCLVSFDRPPLPVNVESGLRNLTALACSTAKGLVAAASGIAIYIWDLETACLKALLFSVATVVSLCITEDGAQLIVLGAEDDSEFGMLSQITLDDLPADGTVPTPQEFRRDVVRLVDSAAISPNGSYFALGSFSKPYYVAVWDLQPCKSIAALVGHTASVTCIAFSPAASEGSLMATGSVDQTIIIWDGTTYRRIATLNQHEERVVAVAFAPDGDRLASASWDNSVRVWCISSQACIATLTHGAGVESVYFFPSVQSHSVRLLTGCTDTIIRVWDISDSALSEHGYGEGKAVDCLAVSPGGCAVAAVMQDIIWIWDIRYRTSLQVRGSGLAYTFHDVTFSTDSSCLLASGMFPGLSLWRRDGGLWLRDRRHSQQRITPSRIWRMAVSPDGAWVVSFSMDHILVEETESGTMVMTGRRNWQTSVVAVAWNDAMSHIAEMDDSGRVRVWGVNAEEDVLCLLYEAPSHLDINSPRWLKFTPHDHIMCGSDLWDILELALPPPAHSSERPQILSRVWPLSAQFIPSRFGWSDNNDAWLLYGAKTSRTYSRVCWLLGDRRPHVVGWQRAKVYAWVNNVVAIGSSTGTVTILRVNEDVI